MSCINVSDSHIKSVVILFFTIVISGCKPPDNNILLKEIKCNVEKLIDTGDKLLSDDGKYILTGVETRNTERAYSGVYSLKLNKNNPYGFTITLDEIYEGYNINIRIWKYGAEQSGGIVADDIKGERFYESSKKIIKEDDNGWKLIEHDLIIPYDLPDNKLKLYVYNPTDSDVYFDDIHIKIYERKIYPDFKEPKLKIIVDSAGMEKLKAKRYEALQNGILETKDGDYVRANIIYLNDTLKASIRLKGDWLDHLYGPKWSFRIKLRKNGQWKGMRSFSIQNPSTRGYLNEWIAHKILDDEDVLTTKYGFIPVELNGKSLGLYAFEEHFDKHLVESRNRREGPILKFSEDHFWITQKVFINTKKYFGYPEVEGASILPFKMNRTMSNPSLKNDFIMAQNLVEKYRNGNLPLDNVFDLEKLAKLHALIDITKAHHGLAWHNKRFYYNPVICKLEQIFFDGFSGVIVKSWRDEPIMGNFNINSIDLCRSYDMINYRMMEDKEFADLYYKYLIKYSNISYTQQIFEKHYKDLKKFEALIRKEVPYYKYDSLFMYNIAAEIRDDLPVFKERLDSDYYLRLKKNKCENVTYTKEYNEEFPEYYVKAFKESDNKIKIINYYPFEIEIKSSLNNATETIILSPYKTNYMDSKIINTRSKVDSIKFSVIAHPELFTIPVYQWKSPSNTAHFQSFIEKYNVVDSRMFKIKKDNIYIDSEYYRISKTIFIPKGYKVHISAGAVLDLNNNSMFISYSPVYVTGSAENPVIIKSGDGTGMGFTLLQAAEKSILKNVIFDQLNTVGYNNWHLTGAVNFYESDVDMTNVTFKNNRCEDALNIIRSKFTLTNCTFDNIFADAFDSDFSEGIIDNSSFRDIANDAMDFSGSTFTIDNCKVINAGDKGISCGEGSELIARNVNINTANIGIASKDLIKITIMNSLISNSKYGYVAFRKKPEYGSAEIYSVNTRLDNILIDNFIEIGSTLIIDNKIIKGTYKKVSDKLYVN